MESLKLLWLLAAVALASAELPELGTNNSDPVPIFSISFDSLLPFILGPRGSEKFDDAIDPREPIENAPQDVPSDNIVIIQVSEVISSSDDDAVDPLTLFFKQNFFLQEKLNKTWVLDLSGRNLTGAELSQELHPGVTTLILSNSRISGLTAEVFAAIQDTLRELIMDNCPVPLVALTNLSNLRFLNLSHNGLSSFEWFPQLSDSLEVLDLSYNEFTEVRPELSVLTNLRELYLQHNSISTVEENPLRQLVNMEVLSLSMNILEKVNIASLNNLQEVDLDWNYLRLFEDVQLPVHRMAVKLASNPWRCDCGILEARDGYDVLDLELLQCANQGSYAYCVDCKRYFLPEMNGRLVANLTKESIEHLGCTGLTDQYYLLQHALEQMRDHEPEKLVNLALLLVTGVLLMVAAIIVCKRACSKNHQSNWLKIQKIPQLSFDKLTKPQQVPYIIIDDSNHKI